MGSIDGDIPAILVLLASFLRFARVFFFFDFLTFNLPCAMLCVVVSLLKPSNLLRSLFLRFLRGCDDDMLDFSMVMMVVVVVVHTNKKPIKIINYPKQPPQLTICIMNI